VRSIWDQAGNGVRRSTADVLGGGAILSRRGFDIGAHGLTHAILTRETKERAFAEIEESLATVSSELGARCRTFAFQTATTHSSWRSMRCVAAPGPS